MYHPTLILEMVVCHSVILMALRCASVARSIYLLSAQPLCISIMRRAASPFFQLTQIRVVYSPFLEHCVKTMAADVHERCALPHSTSFSSVVLTALFTHD